MAAFWSGFFSWVDRAWLNLASVKLTLFVFVCLLLLSIPGTIIMQVNISNVDPGLQYSYEFWKFGKLTQLFTSYHSFWYVGLIAILAMNLIACSVERWPQMWRLANAKGVAWADATFEKQPAEFKSQWKSAQSKEKVKASFLAELKKRRMNPVIVEDSSDSFQIFFQTGRWSRIANYLVHISLLVVFFGAIITSMYGFEGAANIPAKSGVDSFIIFNEGKGAGLLPAPGGLVNERMFGFRVNAVEFDVEFWENWPGRPKDFVSKLQIVEKGKVVKTQTIHVNDPLKYKNFVFYQASYGRLGDFEMKFRVIDKRNQDSQKFIKSFLGQAQTLPDFGFSFVPIRAVANLQGLGPAVQFEELKGKTLSGQPFWVLKNYPEYDFNRKSSYAFIVDDVRELYYTGLQIGYDPGAPIYWLGCLGMLIGTFYALFVTHKKYQLRYVRGKIDFAGSIHRLPGGFEKKIARWTNIFKKLSDAKD